MAGGKKERTIGTSETMRIILKIIFYFFIFCVVISLLQEIAMANGNAAGVLVLLIVIWIVFSVLKSIKKKNEEKARIAQEEKENDYLKSRINTLYKQMKDIYANARKGDITRPVADKFFSCADEALAIIPKIPLGVMEGDDSIKMEIEKMSNQITMILGLRGTSTHVASLGEEIEKLATLRNQGKISDHEFQAFSERFKLATGEKASSVIKAISELYEQHQKGAILEGNYHAALWSLLDKLDRKI